MNTARRARQLLGAMSGVTPNWPGQCRGGVGPASCSPRCLSFLAHNDVDVRAVPPSTFSRLSTSQLKTSPRLRSSFAGLTHRSLHSSTAARATAAAAAVDVEDDTDELLPGRLVEYKRDTRSGLALILRSDGKRNWIIGDHRGMEFSVRPSQISYVLPGYGYKQQDLLAVHEKANGSMDNELLAMAWEISEGKDLYSVAQMAMLLFGSNGTAGELYAAHRLLSDDRTVFKQAARLPVPLFQPRPASEVQMLQARAEAVAKAAKELAEATTAMHAARTSPQESKPTGEAWAKDQWRSYVAALQAFAFEGATQNQQVTSADVLKALSVETTSIGAAQLLRAIGAWGPHDQAALLRANLTTIFPPKLEAQAQELIDNPPPDPDAANRRDLTHLSVVTIDDVSTREVDDGLSIEHRGEGLSPRIWVHIADPTRWLFPGTALDQEARRRSKSLYLPTGAIFMLPSSIAAGPFSLRLNHTCCALSIGMVLDEQGGLAETIITPSTVNVTHRMSFDEVGSTLEASEQLQSRPELQAFHEAAQLRRQWRSQQGAVNFSLDGSYIKVRDAHLADPQISIQPEVPHTPAQSLVAEMMIMAGEATGSYGGQHQLPLPYRGQAKAVLPSEEELSRVPEGPCREVLVRSRMTRSISTIHEPLPHASLGLPAYVQISSPIRRYTDLLAHWQIKAHLRGDEQPFSLQSLSEAVDEAADQAREWTGLERKIRDYWTALYFHQQLAAAPSKHWLGLLLQWHHQEKGLAKVLISDLGMETIAKVDRPAVAGDMLELACVKVDIKEGSYSFSDVGAPVNSTAASELLQHDDEGQDGEIGLDEASGDLHGVVSDEVGVRTAR